MRGETFLPVAVSVHFMKPNWTLRQLLAILRGLAIMTAIFWGLVLLQLVPALLRSGISGVREHIARVAIAGVPPEQWDVAVTRMYAALAQSGISIRDVSGNPGCDGCVRVTIGTTSQMDHVLVAFRRAVEEIRT